MTEIHDWNKRMAKLPAGRREKIVALADKMERGILLGELRRGLGVTQQQLAKAMRVKQASVSKAERRADMQLSTLRKMVEAVGAQLEVTARLPGGRRVNLKSFSSSTRPKAA